MYLYSIYMVTVVFLIGVVDRLPNVRKDVSVVLQGQLSFLVWLQVCMWADLCGSYHTAGNTQYDCWPLNASKVDNAVIDCEGKICCYIGKADCQAIARSINSQVADGVDIKVFT